MMPNTFVDNAKVMSKGQITIPKDVRNILGVSCGDRVSFIVEGNTVRKFCSLRYADASKRDGRRGTANRYGNR